MSSMTMRLLALYFRAAAKPKMSSAGAARQRLQESKTEPPPPASLLKKHAHSVDTLAGFPVHSVRPAPGGAARPAVLFLHGGAYMAPMSPQHWQLVDALADAGVRVDVPIYGLAPEHSYREAYALCTAAYRRLVEDETVGAITIMGDSAGAGLALGFAQTLAEPELPQPNRLCLIAPWLDLTLSNPETAKVRDPWLTPAGLREAGLSWADGDDPTRPELSPINGAVDGLAPLDIYIGTRDLFHPDCILLAKRARKAGVQVTLTVLPGALHVYPLLPAPEGKRARADIIARAASPSRPDLRR